MGAVLGYLVSEKLALVGEGVDADDYHEDIAAAVGERRAVDDVVETIMLKVQIEELARKLDVAVQEMNAAKLQAKLKELQEEAKKKEEAKKEKMKQDYMERIKAAFAKVDTAAREAPLTQIQAEISASELDAALKTELQEHIIVLMIRDLEVQAKAWEVLYALTDFSRIQDVSGATWATFKGKITSLQVPRNFTSSLSTFLLKGESVEEGSQSEWEQGFIASLNPSQWGIIKRRAKEIRRLYDEQAKKRGASPRVRTNITSS